MSMDMIAATLFVLLPLTAVQDKQDASNPEELFRALGKPVSLTVKDTPAREVFNKLFQQSGYHLMLPGTWESKNISVDLQNATFWQAVDKISQADGGIVLSSTSGEGEGLTLETWRMRPIVYAGPLRFSIDDVARIREVRYPVRMDRTELKIFARWTDQYAPVLDPWPYPGTIEVIRAECGGHSLLPPMVVEETFIQSAGGTSNRSSTWLLRLQPARRSDKAISSLDVIWRTVFPLEIENIAFDNPLESKGDSRRAGPFTVTLERCRRDSRGGTGLETQIVLQVDRTNWSSEALKSLQEVSLAQRILTDVDVDGEKERDLFKIVEGPEGSNTVTLRTWLFKEKSPKTITLRIAKRAVLLVTPLSFTNIPLPEEPR